MTSTLEIKTWADVCEEEIKKYQFHFNAESKIWVPKIGYVEDAEWFNEDSTFIKMDMNQLAKRAKILIVLKCWVLADMK